MIPWIVTAVALRRCDTVCGYVVRRNVALSEENMLAEKEVEASRARPVGLPRTCALLCGMMSGAYERECASWAFRWQGL